MEAATSGSRNGEGERWELEKIEINKNNNTKLTPLPVDTCELYCTPVMFARFVCDLLSFRARKFPEKSETQEPREIIMECTLYINFRKLTEIPIQITKTTCSHSDTNGYIRFMIEGRVTWSPHHPHNRTPNPGEGGESLPCFLFSRFLALLLCGWCGDHVTLPPIMNLM